MADKSELIRNRRGIFSELFNYSNSKFKTWYGSSPRQSMKRYQRLLSDSNGQDFNFMTIEKQSNNEKNVNLDIYCNYLKLVGTNCLNGKNQKIISSSITAPLPFRTDSHENPSKPKYTPESTSLNKTANITKPLQGVTVEFVETMLKRYLLKWYRLQIYINYIKSVFPGSKLELQHFSVISQDIDQYVNEMESSMLSLDRNVIEQKLQTISFLYPEYFNFVIIFDNHFNYMSILGSAFQTQQPEKHEPKPKLTYDAAVIKFENLISKFEAFKNRTERYKAYYVYPNDVKKNLDTYINKMRLAYLQWLALWHQKKRILQSYQTNLAYLKEIENFITNKKIELEHWRKSYNRFALYIANLKEKKKLAPPPKNWLKFVQDTQKKPYSTLHNLIMRWKRLKQSIQCSKYTCLQNEVRVSEDHIHYLESVWEELAIWSMDMEKLAQLENSEIRRIQKRVIQNKKRCTKTKGPFLKRVTRLKIEIEKIRQRWKIVKKNSILDRDDRRIVDIELMLVQMTDNHLQRDIKRAKRNKRAVNKIIRIYTHRVMFLESQVQFFERHLKKQSKIKRWQRTNVNTTWNEPMPFRSAVKLITCGPSLQVKIKRMHQSLIKYFNAENAKMVETKRRYKPGQLEYMIVEHFETAINQSKRLTAQVMSKLKRFASTCKFRTKFTLVRFKPCLDKIKKKIVLVKRIRLMHKWLFLAYPPESIKAFSHEPNCANSDKFVTLTKRLENRVEDIVIRFNEVEEKADKAYSSSNAEGKAKILELVTELRDLSRKFYEAHYDWKYEALPNQMNRVKYTQFRALIVKFEEKIKQIESKILKVPNEQSIIAQTNPTTTISNEKLQEQLEFGQQKLPIKKT